MLRLNLFEAVNKLNDDDVNFKLSGNLYVSKTYTDKTYTDGHITASGPIGLEGIVALVDGYDVS